MDFCLFVFFNGNKKYILVFKQNYCFLKVVFLILIFLFFLIFAWVDRMNKIMWRAKTSVFLEKGIFSKKELQNL